MENVKPLQGAVCEEKLGLCLGTEGLPGAAKGTRRFTPQIWKNGFNIQYSVKVVASHTAAVMAWEASPSHGAEVVSFPPSFPTGSPVAWSGDCVWMC